MLDLKQITLVCKHTGDHVIGLRFYSFDMVNEGRSGHKNPEGHVVALTPIPTHWGIAVDEDSPYIIYSDHDVQENYDELGSV